MTIINTIDRTREHLDGIRAEIAALLERRANLMTTTLAELTAAGIDARIVHDRSTREYRIGDRVWLRDTYTVGSDGLDRATRVLPLEVRSTADVGPSHSDGGWHVSLYLDHGTYEVMLNDEKVLLLAKVSDVDDVERGHRLAVCRLRRLADSDGFKVKVRDHTIALVDPMMGTVVHEGTVESAYCWLLNIDLDNAHH